MKLDLTTSNIMTLVIVAMVLIVVIIGGIVVILGNMSYETYINDIEKLAVGVGLTAIGRGIASSKQ